MGISEKLVNLKKRNIAIGCLGLTLVGCGTFGFFTLQVVDFPIVARRASTVEDSYKKAGLPWVAADITRDVSDGDNALKTDLELFSSQTPWPTRNLANLGELVGLQKYKDARKELSNYSKDLEIATRMGSCKAISFEKDWDLSVALMFPEYAHIKSATKLLAFRAEIRASEGDLEGALTDLRLAYNLGNLISEEPTIIASLVGIASHAISLRYAVRIASLKPNDKTWVSKIIKEIDTWETKIDIQTGMRGEFYTGVTLARNLSNKALNPATITRNYGEMMETIVDQRKLVRDGFGKGAVRTAFQVRSMEMSIELDRILKKHPGDPVAAAKAMDDHVIKVTSNPQLKLSDTALKILYPVFTQAGYAIAKDYVVKDMTLAVLRGAEYKILHGKYPKSWSELSMRPVNDPYTGDATRFVSSDKGLMIYSVGANKIDEGGVDTDRGRSGDDFNVYFPFAFNQAD